jgi:hypothetical protein
MSPAKNDKISYTHYINFLIDNPLQIRKVKINILLSQIWRGVNGWGSPFSKGAAVIGGE